MSENDRLILDFATRFEEVFIGQGGVDRDIDKTLALAWELLSPLPLELLKRIPDAFLERYRRQK